MVQRGGVVAIVAALLVVQAHGQFDMGTFKVVAGRTSRDMATTSTAEEPPAPTGQPTEVPQEPATATEPGSATVELRSTTRTSQLATVEDTPAALRTNDELVSSERPSGG
ncbi:uncharacterized protein LOC119109414 [Pollicipes pollicipes]|uniref:uncharacterized protein LOC119109414 n=1 Tax=Pollicipes pollicipes TaxID=41117 RepID=UPI001884FFD8|nr:uncharacterized protein LOC119109414 [Pollicipes pollicipes]